VLTHVSTGGIELQGYSLVPNGKITDPIEAVALDDHVHIGRLSSVSCRCRLMRRMVMSLVMMVNDGVFPMLTMMWRSAHLVGETSSLMLGQETICVGSNLGGVDMSISLFSNLVEVLRFANLDGGAHV
jgi:hypothetical protein